LKIKRYLAGLGAAAAIAGSTVLPSVALAAPPPITQSAHQANFGNLISALNNISAQIGNLQALNNLTVSNVRLVNVNDVLNGNNVNALNNALNNNNVNVLALQNFLNNNLNNNTVTLTNVLSQNNVLVNRVVAINVLSGGDVIVFYQ